MKWEPWVEYEVKGDAALDAPRRISQIVEPPCKACSRFMPIRNFSGILYEGVRLCHAPNMHHDFSCFRSKEDTKP